MFPVDGNLSTSAPAGYKAGEGVWQDSSYQQMNEKRAYVDNNWQHIGHTPSKPPVPLTSGTFPALPVPAKSTGSLLALYTAKEKGKAGNSHIEFAGRSYGEKKVELYSHMRWVS